jgi:enoyl-CoA hydratase/carnithine racemase
MAKQLSFTCKPLSAQDALRCRLVNEVVPPAELLLRAKQIAQDICAVNYDILLQMKALIEKQNEVSFDEACKLEREGFKDFIGKAKLF